VSIKTDSFSGRVTRSAQRVITFNSVEYCGAGLAPVIVVDVDGQIHRVRIGDTMTLDNTLHIKLDEALPAKKTVYEHSTASSKLREALKEFLA
jgi:hypothetical protein